MKTIIVATDFSAISINAAYYAVDMAAAIKAQVLLMHAVSIPLMVAEAPMPAETFETMLDDANDELQKLQEKLNIYSNHKVPITRRAMLGTLLNEIEDIANDLDVFAIAMGIQGAGETNRVLFGSNTINMMRNMAYPIIIVPANASFKGIKNIGLACDLKDVTETIPVDVITNIVSLFNSSFHIFSVSKPDEADASILPESISLQNQFMKLRPKMHLVTNENIETGIFESAEKEKIDLLMIVPKEHGLIYSLFHRSISKAIVTHPHIPMLAIHGR